MLLEPVGKRKATAQGKQKRAKYTEAEKRAFLRASKEKEKKGKRRNEMKKGF